MKPSGTENARGTSRGSDTRNRRRPRRDSCTTTGVGREDTPSTTFVRAPFGASVPSYRHLPLPSQKSLWSKRNPSPVAVSGDSRHYGPTLSDSPTPSSIFLAPSVSSRSPVVGSLSAAWDSVKSLPVTSLMPVPPSQFADWRHRSPSYLTGCLDRLGCPGYLGHTSGAGRPR